MCDPASAMAGTSMGLGLLGQYLSYQNAKQETEKFNDWKDKNDARVMDKLIFDYGQGAQRIADLDKQETQLKDIETANLIEADLAAIRAEGEVEAGEIQRGQSSEVFKTRLVADSLRSKDAIKENAKVNKINIDYQRRDVSTGLELARFDAVAQINSSMYKSDPNAMTYMLGGAQSIAGGFQTYYSMPESTRTWDWGNWERKKTG